MADSERGAGEVAGLPLCIGPYRIVRVLGEGSSGRVYLAEQEEPRRTVALKVLRGNELSTEARQRFRREAELLARLEHPGIARLYAAGVFESDSGPLPYLAMEYIAGTELLKYAQRHPLTLGAKLELLAAISRAVHFAHAHGIVHRDLKPANILVDASGQPHLVDFGIAHIAHGPFAAMTVAGQVLGTVPYMSGEQLVGSVSAQDPRADVYSLGVIAYELLSGRLPYPGLSTSTVVEAIAIIRGGRIEKLSRLVPAARGDIETVIMKAMAQEAPRRYGSAAELAADFERYLQRRPIEARPPTAAYLLGLFVRRHRAVSAAIAIAVLALFAGTTVSIHYGLSEAQARADAERRATETAAVNRFLNDMLVSADPAHTRGRALTVAETLSPAREQLRADRTLGNEARAMLAATLSNTYAALGEIATARQIAHDARLATETQLGMQSAAAVRLRVAEAEAMQNAGDLQAANRLLLPVIDTATPSGDDPRPRLRAAISHGTGTLYLGEQQAALQRFRQTLATATTLLPGDDPLLLDIRQSYVSSLFNSGAYEEAMAGYRALIDDETHVLGSDHPTTLLTRMDYADRLRQLAHLADAEREIRGVIADRERISGAQHYWTLLARYVLCATLDQDGRAADALPLINAVVAGLRSSLGDSSPDTLNAMVTQANIERSLKHYGNAERDYREIIALRARTDAGTHPESLFPINGLALTLIDSGREEEGLRLLRDALPKADGNSEHNLLYGRLLGSYGYGLMRQQQWSAARDALEEARAIIDKALDAHHPITQTIYRHLVTTYAALGQREQADAIGMMLDAPR